MLEFFYESRRKYAKKCEKGVHREIGKGPNQALGS
jgi:hypothetical protein